MKRERILVLGGEGKTGRPVAVKLRERGKNTVGLSWTGLVKIWSR